MLTQLICECLNTGRVEKLADNVHEYLFRMAAKAVYMYEYTYVDDALGYVDHMKNTSSILSAFVVSGVFEKTVMETDRVTTKRSIKYILSNRLDLDVLRAFKFPFVVCPDPLSADGLNTIIKPLVFGKGSVSKSEILLNALNTSRTKKFVIDKQFLEIAESLLINKEENKSSMVSQTIDSVGVDFGVPRIMKSINCGFFLRVRNT